MANKALVNALLQREADYVAALDRIRETIESDPETTTEDYVAVRQLREAVELVRCLRRIVPSISVADIHRAFGAPGDFGYETPIGDALSRLYRGES